MYYMSYSPQHCGKYQQMQASVISLMDEITQPYEESDCIAGITDDMATNQTKPSVNSEETIFFRMSFLLQKTGQAKRS